MKINKLLNYHQIGKSPLDLSEVDRVLQLFLMLNSVVSLSS